MSVGGVQPGTLLAGKYRVIRQLGEGGMGAVLEAEHSVTGRRVALKWMHQHIASNSDAARRFIREAQASARVRHPNVVDVYDVVQDGTTLLLVMELLEGEPLSALLDRGALPLHSVISLLLPAMRGVAAAHEQGVIHRDIKPDNVFLAHFPDQPAPVPKVLDFGISKVTDNELTSLTRTGATLGTPLYMSFEQLSGEKNIDARTDVYAFGVILYEAMTGQPPFLAESFTELAIKVATTEPIPPKALRPDLPSSLADIVMRAMAKKREERIPSLNALIRELEVFATEPGYLGQLTAAQPAAVSARSVAPVAHAGSEIAHTLDARERFVEGTEYSVPGRVPVARNLAILTAVLLVLVGGWWLWKSEHPADGTHDPAASGIDVPASPDAAETVQGAQSPGSEPPAPEQAPRDARFMRDEALPQNARAPVPNATVTGKQAPSPPNPESVPNETPRVQRAPELQAPVERNTDSSKRTLKEGFRAGQIRSEDF